MRATAPIRLGILVAVLLGVAPGAHATLMKITFTGSVTGVPTAFLGTFNPTDPASGTIFFESSTQDNLPGDPNSAVYDGALNGVTHTVQFGGYTATGDMGSITMSLGAFDIWTAFVGNVSGAGVVGFTLVDVILALEDNTGSAFPDDSLPTSFDLNDFSLEQARLVFQDAGMNFATVTATLTSISVSVPEPSSGLLLLVALALPAALRSRRAR